MGESFPPWPADMVERARKLYVDQGLSGTTVAAILGVSRNAVIGQASRRGWRRSIEVARINSVMAAKAGARATSQQPVFPFAKPRTAAELEALQKGTHLPAAAVETAARTLADLGAGECRFPVGEADGADQLFCARPFAGRGPYCDDCQASRQLTNPTDKSGDRKLAAWINRLDYRPARGCAA